MRLKLNQPLLKMYAVWSHNADRIRLEGKAESRIKVQNTK